MYHNSQLDTERQIWSKPDLDLFRSICSSIFIVIYSILALHAPKTLSLVQRIDIAINVSSALDYLHNNCETPIVHCDLTPGNILLDKELTAHVSDFGLARILSKLTDNVSGTQSSSIGIRGSIGYAAPEIFTGKRPTNHMFSGSLNLQDFVRMALPEHVEEITDSLLEGGFTTVNEAQARNQAITRQQQIKECLKSIFGIGIACSVESQTNRKDISDVVSELHTIRKNLLGLNFPKCCFFLRFLHFYWF
ncbi:hypothetical protein ACLB2K_029247 [Fragaria x ananassa]